MAGSAYSLERSAGGASLVTGEAKGLLMVGTFLASANANPSVCEDLYEHLSKRGWSIVSTSSRSGRIAMLVDMLSTTFLKRKHYACAQVDVYSGPSFIWAEAVCLMLRIIGKPYVLSLHGGNLPSFAEIWRGRVRRLLRSASVVTTPSAYLNERMRPYRDDLKLLYNPLDIGAYSFKPRKQPEPKLVWLRAFHHMYNPELAVKVVDKLAEDFPSILLTMIGPDRGDGALQSFTRLTAELNLKGRVNLTGIIAKHEVPHWLDRGDIFLNTTNIDNTPISVLEAMACGLCVVSTNAGGLPYLLEDGKDALLVPVDEPVAMAAAVRRVLTEPGLAKWLSSNARKKAEQFDRRTIIMQWEELLSGIVHVERNNLNGATS